MLKISSGDCVINSPSRSIFAKWREPRANLWFAAGNFSSFKNFTNPRISATARWSAAAKSAFKPGSLTSFSASTRSFSRKSAEPSPSSMAVSTHGLGSEPSRFTRPAAITSGAWLRMEMIPRTRSSSGAKSRLM